MVDRILSVLSTITYHHMFPAMIVHTSHPVLERSILVRGSLFHVTNVKILVKIIESELNVHINVTFVNFQQVENHI